MNSETITAVRNQTITVEQEKKGKARKSEMLFGLIMAVAAVAGIWGAVSLMISWFLAS